MKSSFATGVLVLFSAALCALTAYVFHTYGIPEEPVTRALFFLSLALLGLNALMATVLRKWKSNYVLSLTVIGSSLFLLELLLWGSGIGPAYPKAITVAEKDHAKRVHLAAEAKVPFDTRTKEEVLRQLRKDGVEAYPAFFEWPDEKMVTFSSISGKLALVGNEGGEYSSFQADEYGFNNPLGLHRIGIEAVLVGGSFATGYGIAQGADIAGLLRASGLPTLNFGIIGGGPLGKLAVLREYAAQLRPKIAILDLSERMDLLVLAQELRNAILKRYLIDPTYTQSLSDRQGEVDTLLRQRIDQVLLAESRDKSAGNPILNALRLRNLRMLAQRAVDGLRLRKLADAPPLAELREVLEMSKREVESWGGKLVVLYLPHQDFYAAPEGKGGPYFRDETLGLCRELGIPVINHLEAVRAHPDPTSLFPLRVYEFGHFNAEGYRLVSQSVLKGLRNQGLWPTRTERPQTPSPKVQ